MAVHIGNSRCRGVSVISLALFDDAITCIVTAGVGASHGSGGTVGSRVSDGAGLGRGAGRVGGVPSPLAVGCECGE